MTSSSDETIPSLNQLEQIASPIVLLKLAEDNKRKRDLELEEEKQEKKRRAKERKLSNKEREQRYIAHMIKHHKDTNGASTSLTATHVDTTLPRPYIVDLASRESICKLIEFRFTCRGFKHLRCEKIVVVTPETAQNFPWCEECVEVHAMYGNYQGFGKSDSDEDGEDEDADKDDK